MHIDELIKNYNPMYPTGGTWQDTFKVLQEDPIEFSIVQQLVADLEEHGEFREPIVLSTQEEYVKDWEDYEFDEGEELEPYSPCVKNGTHRVFAHYLSKHKDAKVQFGWHPNDEESDVEEDFYPMIASRISYPPELDDDAIDNMFSKCRSFKLTEEVWINSDMMSSDGNMFHFYWDTGLEKIDNLEPYVSLIHTKVQEIVKEIGFDSIIDTVILGSEAEDDLFFNLASSNA